LEATESFKQMRNMIAKKSSENVFKNPFSSPVEDKVSTIMIHLCLIQIEFINLDNDEEISIVLDSALLHRSLRYIWLLQ